MGEVRIHRGDPEHYLKWPNELARWPRLSWAARGYLAEMLTNEPGWEPETVEQAAARARGERGELGSAESAGAARRIGAELEREGFKHRLRYRAGRGRHVTEVHYYAWPALPCEDPRCATCAAHGITATPKTGGSVRPAETGKPPGRADPSDSGGRPDATDPPKTGDSARPAQTGVSPGRADPWVTEGSVNGGSTRRRSPEDDQTEDENTPTGQKTPGPPGCGPPDGGRPPQPHNQLHDQAVARDRLTGGLAREYQLGPADEATVQGWIDGGMHAAEARNRIRARDRRPAVAARYDAGYSIGQIAEAMGLSVHQVTGDVASLGHTCNGKPLWDYPEAERATFRLISRAVDRRFTAGESIAEIAEAEHRTPAQIAAYLDAAGWAMGHGGPPLSSLPDGELADLRVQAPRAAAREGEQGTCARPGCGEPFTARGHGQKYCTPGCQRAEQIRRAAERRQAR